MQQSNWGNSFQEYWLDSWQRAILTLDVLRDRGNTYEERKASKAPHVLGFKVELVMDGRTLSRPVNYLLVRIVPDEAVEPDPKKPPFIIVDPRAGHGPGIGGMKQESEIGVALAAGHPCYFIGFLPRPVPGQTIEDVCRAEATFVKKVAALHPEAEGKPILIANCQAGWQTMMMAAIAPELAGPILLAGSPLSYWAGVRGKNPLRYLGGVLGGTWLTALAGDLGHGIFDGANLVANFKSLNLANTYWQKAYNVYSKVDTEARQFLDFETWWGSPVLLNAGEMQWIADNLFVGNRLSNGEIRASSGLRVDLRNIRSPIIVFCSWGDNITPPQQALGWITDLYDHEDEIVRNGQTIVYTLHQTIGHLGIFVSGKVAAKEHGEFATCMDMIDLMPPGLYEAVITEVDRDTENPELIEGRYLFRLEARGLGDIRALGNNDESDDRRFAAASRVSETNHGLYQTFLCPAIRAATTEASAEAMRAMHPNRLRFAMFSDHNPAMRPVKALAEQLRKNRRPSDPQNPFLALEKATSSSIGRTLEFWGDLRDMWTEAAFLGAYGSPFLQALVGLGAENGAAHRRIERDLAREAAAARLRADLTERFDKGGAAAAAIRALIYVRLPGGSADERGFAMIKAIRAAQPAETRLSMEKLKDMMKEQYLLIRFDERRAIATLPKLLPPDEEERLAILEVVRRVLTARGPLPEEDRRRFNELEAIFGATAKPIGKEAVHA